MLLITYMILCIYFGMIENNEIEHSALYTFTKNLDFFCVFRKSV